MPEIETSDGLRLHVESAGQGPTVILSCGLCTNSVNFAPQVEPWVAAGFRVVRWDYRGHGRSDAPDDAEAYSFDQVVDDLGRVIDWASPDDAVVLGGLSFGGLASLHYTHRHPKRVRALLLFGSGPGFKKPEAQAGWQKQCDRTASYILEKGLERFVSGAAGKTCVGLEPELPAAKEAAASIVAQSPQALAHFSRRVGGPAPPVIDELADLDHPALVLVGELDEPYLRAADVMESKLAGGRKVVIPGAGHISNLERSAAFDDAVLEFLGSLPAA